MTCHDCTSGRVANLFWLLLTLLLYLVVGVLQLHLLTSGTKVSESGRLPFQLVRGPWPTLGSIPEYPGYHP